MSRFPIADCAGGRASEHRRVVVWWCGGVVVWWCGNAGLQGCRAEGFWGSRAVGFQGFRVVGFQGFWVSCWVVGLLGCWVVGLWCVVCGVGCTAQTQYNLLWQGLSKVNSSLPHPTTVCHPYPELAHGRWSTPASPISALHCRRFKGTRPVHSRASPPGCSPLSSATLSWVVLALCRVLRCRRLTS